MSATLRSTSWQRYWRLLKSSRWKRLLSSWWTWVFGRQSPVYPAVAPICCTAGKGGRCGIAVVTGAVATPAANEGASAPAVAFEAATTEGPTFDKRVAWLTERGLLSPSEGLSEEQVVRRHEALSKCAFGEAVGEEARRDFLRRLLPCEARLAAKQTDIGRVEDPRYHYRLKLRNEVGIKARPMRLRPEEEAWLDVHLDELVSKGVIGPILPDE